MNLAKKCGINIPEIKLINSKSNKKYFLIKRFDRNGNDKIHMISVAALLEVDFRAPSLDYNELIKLTRILTSKEEDVLEISEFTDEEKEIASKSKMLVLDSDGNVQMKLFSGERIFSRIFTRKLVK
jgi:hypothetical protein